MSAQELKELRLKQEQLATQARAKLDEVKDDTPAERSAEIENEFDAMMEEHDKIGQRADRVEKSDRALAAAKSAAEEIDERKRPNSGGGEQRGEDEGDNAPSYRSAFHGYMKAQGQMGMLSNEERQVLSRGFEEVPAEERAQTTANAAGGYAVPEEMREILIRSMLAWGPMYDPTVTTEMVTNGGNSIPMPTVNDTASGTDAKKPAAHTEGQSLADTGAKDVVFGQKELNAFAFNTDWLRVSKELNDDSFLAMETLLGSLLGERMGRVANAQLTVGTGSSAPNGIVTASGLGNTAVGAAAITFDEFMDLEHSVDPAYRTGPSVKYMFNDGTLAALRKLKDGDGNYLWQQGNVKAGVPNLINGREYVINQAMASMATGEKPIVFGDFSKYFVRKVGAPLIGAMQDKDFWPGFGVAGYIRFDGELSDQAAVKHLLMA